MQEGDVQTFGTLAGLLVNEAYALLANLCQCFGYTILYAECYVVNTLVAFVQPFLDGALRRCGLQQLKFNLAALQEGGLYFLVLYRLNGITLQPQYILKEWKALFNALDSDAQMLNV